VDGERDWDARVVYKTWWQAMALAQITYKQVHIHFYFYMPLSRLKPPINLQILFGVISLYAFLWKKPKSLLFRMYQLSQIPCMKTGYWAYRLIEG
jgi:hypothetical protein